MNKIFFLLLIFFSGPLFSMEKDKLLNSQDFKGSEIFCHNPQESNALDLFQHCYLRLVHKEDFYKDIAINFQVIMKTDSKVLEAVPLLIGSYPMKMFIQNFSIIWNQYYFKGEVQSFRSLLNLSQKELDNLIESINEFKNDPSLVGKYTLLNNNCVGGIISLFKHANILDEDIKEEYHPKSFSKWIINTNLSYTPAQDVYPNNIVSLVANLFGLAVSDLQDQSKWPSNASEILEENISDTNAIRTLLLSNINMPHALRKYLSLKNRFKNKSEYENITQLQGYPVQYYGNLISEELFIEILNDLNSSNIPMYIEQKIKNTSSTYRNTVLDYFKVEHLKSFNLEQSNQKVRLATAFKKYYLGKCIKDDSTCSNNQRFRRQALKLPITIENDNAIYNGQSCRGRKLTRNKIGKDCYFFQSKSENKIDIYFYYHKETK